MQDMVYLASGLRTIIIDTGASLSISNHERDFFDGYEPCDIELQGIGSGLRVKGKGKVRWRFQRADGGFVVIECMAYYAPSMKFYLFSLQSYFPENAVSEDAAFYTCATAANKVNLPQKVKLLLQWHCRLGHCSIKLVRWLASKGIIRGSVDSSSNILCDSCRIACGSRRPVNVEHPDKKMKSKLAPTVKSVMRGIMQRE